MNPLSNVRFIKELNEREIKLGINPKSSWHNQYKDSAWVFIGGLAYSLTEGDIICVFSQYGEIVNLNLIRDKTSGKSKGYCFLCYEDQRSTILAVDNLNGIKLTGRTIRVDHVANYRIPKDHADVDDVTRTLREQGCGPAEVKKEEEEEEEEEDDVVIIKTRLKKEKKNKKVKKEKKRKRKSSSSSYDSSSSEDKPVKRKKLKDNKEKPGDSDQNARVANKELKKGAEKSNSQSENSRRMQKSLEENDRKRRKTQNNNYKKEVPHLHKSSASGERNLIHEEFRKLQECSNDHQIRRPDGHRSRVSEKLVANHAKSRRQHNSSSSDSSIDSRRRTEQDSRKRRNDHADERSNRVGSHFGDQRKSHRRHSSSSSDSSSDHKRVQGGHKGKSDRAKEHSSRDRGSHRDDKSRYSSSHDRRH